MSEASEEKRVAFGTFVGKSELDLSPKTII